LADDSGLEVDALGGAPGVHSARYAGPVADDGANNLKLLAALASVPSAERTARFRCVLAYALPGKGLFTAVGECAGLIGTQLCGVGGFGYDPLFVIPATGKTLAQMSLTEKGKISHRGLALKEMAIQLARYYDANRCDK
jgi:XTP/dITP diphosphohydrolase